MRKVDLSTGGPPLQELLELAKVENLILSTSEGREFLLAEVDNFEPEIELVRQNQELIAFLDLRSRETQTYTLEQVRERLGLSG